MASLRLVAEVCVGPSGRIDLNNHGTIWICCPRFTEEMNSSVSSKFIGHEIYWISKHLQHWIVLAMWPFCNQ